MVNRYVYFLFSNNVLILWYIRDVFEKKKYCKNVRYEFIKDWD